MATVTVHCPRCDSDEVYRLDSVQLGVSDSVVSLVVVYSSSATGMKPEL